MLLQDKLVQHQTVHAQLDKLTLMKFVMLVDINVPLVKDKLPLVLNVLQNQTELPLMKKHILVNVKSDFMMMDIVLIVIPV